MKLSFVIPCYGSEHTIGVVICEIEEIMSQKPEYDYEIICVNDCSPDNAIAILKQLVISHTKVIIADLTRNMGKHAAVMAGYSLISGDIIVNVDDDGQCPMPQLWDLIKPLDNGYDISIAKYPDKKQSRFKNFGSRINKIMAQSLIDMPKNLTMSNFNALKRFIVDEILRYQNPYPYIDGLMLRTTQRIAQVDMEQRERTAGKSYFTFRKSLALWLNGFTAFSVKPLRITTIIGIIVAIIGFVVGIIIVFRKLFITPDMAMGYPSTITIILFIGGIIMGMLGMLGEYVGRIYISINKSPQYVIREIVKGGGSD